MRKEHSEIFVSIASYRDSELIPTIEDLYAKAKNPDYIRVVVLLQTDFETIDYHKAYFEDRNVEIYSIDYRLTKGVSYIRSKIQHFIENEKYYLQIDSHMRFGEHWDEKFINYLQKANSKKPVISFYPVAYTLEDGLQAPQVIRNEIRGLNLRACSAIGHGLSKELCARDNGDDKPIQGNTIAAGFLFAPIEYVKEVPYDPEIFWNYEESDQTYRSFTHGWDIFVLPECLIWHKYNTGGTSPKHFTEITTAGGRENKSNEHAENKYFNPKYKTDYPLGKARSLEEFEILNNIEFESRVHNKEKENKDILIVVPYRNREEHLKTFLKKTPKYFDDRNITYDILIAELDDIGEWNAGLSCNSLINFRKKANYKYLYIHHVDVYPIEGEWKFPEEGTVYKHLGDVGSCLMRFEDFFTVGGYRNVYWGWGAEDDDIYNKLLFKGFKVVDVTLLPDYPVRFDTAFQDHERVFKGVNYSTNLEVLYRQPNRNEDSVFDTNHYGRTHKLTKIGPNIYKQNIEPLVKAPVDTKKDNLIVSYIKNMTLGGAYPFIKSVCYFAQYNYDITIIDASPEPNQDVIKELESFGCNIVYRKPTYNNLFLDRLDAFREYFKSTNYKKVLHLDFQDIFLQGNPFDIIKDTPEGSLVMTSEGIPIENQSWNSQVVKICYGQQMHDAIGAYEVINCGVIGGDPEAFCEMVDIVEKEYETLPPGVQAIYGVDQAIMLKLIYGDQKIRPHVLREDNPLAIHLHTYFNDPKEFNRFKNISIINNNIVKNSNYELFKIVHQFNRSPEMYRATVDHFVKSLRPPQE